MATRGEEALCSPEGLICPLCTDVFEDATLLTCGHTFCRKCLKMYDASHLDRDHMVCPLCRRDTQFRGDRVEGLPANVTVNGLVDDYHGNTGGLFASLEDTQNCTACQAQEDAISYCNECRHYMCSNCHNSHQQLTSFFNNHKTVSISEVSSGRFNITQHPERCPTHKQEAKDMFCEICKVYICFKCVIVAHRDHTITNHSDYVKELQTKVTSLVERCKARMTELERNIQNTETRRREVHTAVQKVEAEVIDAYERKASQLKENERLLLEKLQSLKKGYDDDLDAIKAKDRQIIKSIASSMSLVANDRLGCLEADSLAAHCLLCDELEQISKDDNDDTSAGIISGTAQRTAFKPADGSLLHIGIIDQHLTRVRRVDLPEEIANDETSATEMSKTTVMTVENVFKPDDGSVCYLGEIIQTQTRPRISRAVDQPEEKANDDKSAREISTTAGENLFKPSDMAGGSRLHMEEIVQPSMIRVSRAVDIGTGISKDDKSVREISKTTEGNVCKSAHGSRLHQEEIDQNQAQISGAVEIVKDDTSPREITKTAGQTLVKPAETSCLDKGEILKPSIRVRLTTEMAKPSRVSMTVNLRRSMLGMSAVSQDTVVIGYGGARGADKVDTKGNVSQHFPQDGRYYDLAHQTFTGNTVASMYGMTNQLGIYSHNGSHIHTQKITNNCTTLYPTISSNSRDEIIMSNMLNCITIYNPSISTQLCSITIMDMPLQAFETRSGAIVASTCYHNPSKVTAYDRSGREGDALTAHQGEYLYAAVDSQDRVYVASVNQRAGKVVITQYMMDGLNFKKVFQYEELKLILGKKLCYMVSLSVGMLAFACGNKLYFIVV